MPNAALDTPTKVGSRSLSGIMPILTSRNTRQAMTMEMTYPRTINSPLIYGETPSENTAMVTFMLILVLVTIPCQFCRHISLFEASLTSNTADHSAVDFLTVGIDQPPWLARQCGTSSLRLSTERIASRRWPHRSEYHK